MNIKTMHSVGDVVFFINESNISKVSIDKIEASIDKNKQTIKYISSLGEEFKEEDLKSRRQIIDYINEIR